MKKNSKISLQKLKSQSQTKTLIYYTLSLIENLAINIMKLRVIRKKWRVWEWGKRGIVGKWFFKHCWGCYSEKKDNNLQIEDDHSSDSGHKTQIVISEK